MARAAGAAIEHADDESTPTSASRRGGGAPLERVTVNLAARASRALQQAAELTGDTKTDSINRAIQIYAYLEDITARGGAIYVRESADGELERLKMF